MDDKQYAKLTEKMIEYDKGSPKRIQHFLKVHAFARMIGIEEGLDEETMYVLETAALVHDIGIRNALATYGSENGKLQESIGPLEANKLLNEAGGYTSSQLERIEYLIAHHHTYDDIQGIDYQILVEADFLVNLFENSVKYKGILAADKRIFKTSAGKRILATMYQEE